MRVEINVAGLSVVLPTSLEVYRAITFEGSGDIRASAISRDSKNRYNVYIITTSSAWHRECKSMTEAKRYLEKWYMRRGSLLTRYNLEEEYAKERANAIEAGKGGAEGSADPRSERDCVRTDARDENEKVPGLRRTEGGEGVRSFNAAGEESEDHGGACAEEAESEELEAQDGEGSEENGQRLLV